MSRGTKAVIRTLLAAAFIGGVAAGSVALFYRVPDPRMAAGVGAVVGPLSALVLGGALTIAEFLEF